MSSNIERPVERSTEMVSRTVHAHRSSRKLYITSSRKYSLNRRIGAFSPILLLLLSIRLLSRPVCPVPAPGSISSLLPIDRISLVSALILAY